MPEPLPHEEFLDLVNTNWNGSNVAEPRHFDVNDNTEFRVNVRSQGDIIVYAPDTPALEETPIGNWTYVSHVHRVICQLVTTNSRQRLWDLARELRRICHTQRHTMTNFQRIQFLRFDELITDHANVWEGRVMIRLENNGILANTTN